MSLELTFKSVCETIKSQNHNDPTLIESVDYLLGFALVCSPVVLGPAAAALLPTLAVKNELVKIGKRVFDKCTNKKDSDYILRHETMRTAYGLLVFTSFFDSLDARIPDALRKEIGLEAEKTSLAKDAVDKTAFKIPEVLLKEAPDAPASIYTFPFPHPTETLADQCQRQAKLWKQMGQGFAAFVQSLSFWDDADEKKRSILISSLEKIEEEAARRFEAQYFELARRFEEFAVWANLQAHKGTKALIGQLSDYVKYHAKLSASTEKSIDVGFQKLRETVLSIPEVLHIQQATDIAESLNRHYQARINEPVIEDKETDDDDKPRLSFPKVCEAFVPQAFRVLRQAGKSRRLEDELTWSGLARRNDIGPFLLSYLSSPYSTDAPLLILGHPGSGKSLLTTILSAKLMSKQFTAIRVPLREVNADADIVTQIEEAIRKITGIGFDSWIKLSALFKNCPPLVILDGYDELLQASGQVFASYIKDAQRLQEREAEQGRPLRIIITSRITLIDKAAVPVGSTIIRLLEFDQHQRECWSEIWNKTNGGYFRDTGFAKFALPHEQERGAEKILSLAEQPLLLLMLALYDSQGNQLRDSKGLDRTKLYDSLLRRFVIRERGKEKGFKDENGKEREKSLSKEMQRLGVAALGMFNRRKVHILSPELDDDLAFFKLEREVAAKHGRTLSQADLLLGSFFFVHKSKAQHCSGAEDTHEETAAFEFLHNTFGEFLTADFILRRAIAQVQAVRAAESSEALRPVLDKMMGTADGFERDWFASLVYTPLHTRPVIMEMIREWTPHVLKEHKLSEEEFIETLEKIVQNQIMRVLNKREMPQIMRKETAQEGYRVPFGDHPLVGHIAIYSINLVLLRLVTGKPPYIFNECEIATHEDGTRPWDRLMHIWRGWFSLGNLNGLTAVMLAERSNLTIKITAKNKFKAEESRSKLQEFHNVALSLGDNILSGISGLYLFDYSASSLSEFDSLAGKLDSEGLDLGLPLAIARLLALAKGLPHSANEFNQCAERTIRQALQTNSKVQLEHVCFVLARAITTEIKPVPLSMSGGTTFRSVLHPMLVCDIAMRDQKSARVFVELAKQLHEYEWLDEFWGRFLEIASHEMPRFWEQDVPDWAEFLRLLREGGNIGLPNGYWRQRNMYPNFFEHMFHPQHLRELRMQNPESALAYLQCMRELGGRQNFERFFKKLDKDVLKEVFQPYDLIELSEHNPEAVMDYLLALRELFGNKYFRLVFDLPSEVELLQSMFRPQHMLELSSRNPTATLKYLQCLRELGGQQSLTQFWEPNLVQKLFERMFHSRYRFHLSERNFQATLSFLQILLEVGGKHYLVDILGQHMDHEFLERIFHPRNLLELSERDLEAALAYLEILRELDGGQHFERLFERRVDQDFFERMLHPRRLLQATQRQVSSLCIWLGYARIFKSERFTQMLIEAISKTFPSKTGLKHSLSYLPISSLADLRWLAGQSENHELRTFVATLLE